MSVASSTLNPVNILQNLGPVEKLHATFSYNGTITNPSNQEAERTNMNGYTVQKIDGVILVRDVDQRTRDHMKKALEMGLLGMALAGTGIAALFAGSVVIPVVWIVGYKIAGSGIVNAVAIIGCWVLGSILLANSSGKDADKKKEIAEGDQFAKAQAIRQKARNAPADIIKNPADYPYFHTSELADLWRMAVAAKANGLRALAKSDEIMKNIFELDALFSDKLREEMSKDMIWGHHIGDLYAAWKNLGLVDILRERDEKIAKIRHDEQVALGAVNFTGNMLKGTGNMIKKTDKEGSDILHGVGSAINFVTDNTIGHEVRGAIAKDIKAAEDAAAKQIASKKDEVLAIVQNLSTTNFKN